MKSRTSHYTPGGAGAGPQGSSGGMEARVKSGRRKGGPDRDRAYWETPQSAIGRIQGRVVDIESDEPEPGLPTTRRQRISQTLWRRRAALTVGLAAIVVLVAVTVLVPGISSHPGASPTPFPTQIAQVPGGPSSLITPNGLATPTANDSLYPGSWVDSTLAPIGPEETPTQTPAPVLAKGWPVTLGDAIDFTSGEMLTVGPDGTVYIPGLPPVNSKGYTRDGWLRLPDGSYSMTVAFGSEGTIYVTPYDAGSSDGSNQPGDAQSSSLYAFAPNGQMRAGWPINVGDLPTFEPGPSGNLYVFSVVNATTTVTVLTPAGKTAATWAVGSEDSDTCGDVIRSDGTLFYAYASSPGDDCSILVYSPTGSRLSTNPQRGWDGLTMAPDGTVIGVGYDMEPYNSAVVAQTRLAVMGTDGQPAAGWPIKIEGAVSKPSFGQDGTMYVAQIGLGTASSKVLALDQAGAVKTGWPVSLPLGYAPFSGDDTDTPLPPTIGNDGTVYVAATTSDWMGSVTAFDPSGAVVPGWPYALPQVFANFDGGGIRGESPTNPGPMFVRSSSGGLLYLALDGEAVALGPDGKVAAGWPYLLPGRDDDGDYWEQVVALPDGGLLVVCLSGGSDKAVPQVRRLTSAGKLAR